MKKNQINFTELEIDYIDGLLANREGVLFYWHGKGNFKEEKIIKSIRKKIGRQFTPSMKTFINF